jgi:uncharacterized protein YndB with AHSA1/START domain
MKTLDKGTYLEVDGRPAVRFVRRYPYDVQRVWKAITDPDELRHWFPSPEVSYEPHAGGGIELSGDPNTEKMPGKVLAFDPPHRFAFDWGEDELHFTLAAAGEGCQLELLNILAGSGQAARNAAGWEVCLDQLRKTIEGSPGAGPREPGALEWTPLLEHYLASGFPDDGWRPDET